jgi:hypothetical protein
MVIWLCSCTIGNVSGVVVALGVSAMVMVDVGVGIASSVGANAELVGELIVEPAEQAANAGTTTRR